MKTKLGWHFTGATLRDGSAIPPVGEWLVHEGPIVPCDSGLHMSEEPWDALQNAPGNHLHRVELRGELQPHGDPIDKWVGRERRILKSLDCEYFLRRYAKDQALIVAHRWDMPDIVREYLEGDDESLRAEAENVARTAWSEAWEPIRSAAAKEKGEAARTAFWESLAAVGEAEAWAWKATWKAAWLAAWLAASEVAGEVAGVATREEFNKRVEELVVFSD